MNEILCDKCADNTNNNNSETTTTTTTTNLLNSEDKSTNLELNSNTSVGTAMAKCIDYNSYLCSKCLIKHQLNNAFMNHKLLSLSVERTNEINNNNKVK